jgi:hypothetical protein
MNNDKFINAVFDILCIGNKMMARLKLNGVRKSLSISFFNN